MYSWVKIICCLLLTSNLSAQYIYEANQSLYDLQTNSLGSTGLGSNDDAVSSAFNIGFTFDFYGESFTQARMATNGCLHFKTSGAYCNDFTPDPLASQYTYTLLPFWTDLIKDNGSGMRARAFADYTIFGWYKMREYNEANTDNSFEVWLYPNDTFEFRYGGLDIDRHDVLIGEIGSGSKQFYQYYYHDECNTGSTNASNCVNTNWNDTSTNNLLENGGSLFGVGTGNGVDCSNVLNNSNCAGYAEAYQTQQCDLDQLYAQSCPYYWDAYEDQQCDLNPQYAPFCTGYNQQDSVAYFDEEQVDYGFNEEDMWYDEEFDEWLDPNDPCYQNNCADFTDADWYALDAEQFGQEQVDEWFGSDISFNDDGMVEWDSTPMDSYDDVDVMMDVWDVEQDIIHQEEMMLEEFLFQESFLVEDYREPSTFIELETVEQLDEWFEEENEHHEEMFEEEELAYAEEPEEEFLEELFEEEAVEEIFEEVFEEEFQVAEREEATGKSSLTRELALNVISSALVTAQASVSGTTSGTTIHATGGTTGASSSNVANSGGISTSSSPSMSDQIASASVQTNQLLDMSFNSTVSTSMASEVVEVETVSTSLSVDTTTTQTIQNEIDVSVSTETTASASDLIADKILAQNIEAAQDDVAAQQEETGAYGAEDTIIAYMGFVPDFNSYRLVAIPQQETWYEPKSIYANNMLADNITGFYQMAGQSLNTLIEMKRLQPNL